MINIIVVIFLILLITPTSKKWFNEQKQMQQFEKIFIILDAFIIGLIITLVLPEKTWGAFQNNKATTITISTDGNYNIDAQGNEIELAYIEVDGKRYYSPDLLVEGRWGGMNNTLRWNTYTEDLSNEITIKVPSGQRRKLVFTSGIYRGIANINVDGQVNQVDFYEECDNSYRTYELKSTRVIPYLIELMLKVLFGVGTTLFAAIVLLDILLWYRRKKGTSCVLDIGMIQVFCAYTLSITITYTNSIFSQYLPWTDSDVFLYIGKLLSRGQCMYKNIFDHKGPWLYTIEFLGYKLTGDYHGVWILETLQLFLYFTLMYRIIRKYMNPILSVIVIVIAHNLVIYYMSHGNYLESYSLLLIAAGLNVFIDYFYQKNSGLTKRQGVLLGMTFGLAVMLRPNVAALWPAFCLIIIIYTIYKKEYRLIGQYAGTFILGMMFVFGPILIYLQINNAINDFIYDYFIFNFAYASNGESLKVILKFFFCNWTYVLSVIGIITAFCIKQIREKYGVVFLTATVVWNIISCFFVIMPKNQFIHYAIILLPCYTVDIMLAADVVILFGKRMKQTIIYEYIIAASAIMCFMYLVFPANCLAKSFRNSLWIMNFSTSNNLEERVVSRMVQENTEKDSKISVYGNCVKYYLLCDRMSASKYIYQNPISLVDKKVGEQYIEDLQKNQPSAFIIPDVAILQSEAFKDMNANIMKMMNSDYYLAYSSDNVAMYIHK